MSSLHIDITRGDIRYMTEFDIIGARNFSLAHIHIDDEGTMSWRRGAQHQQAEEAEHDEFMLALFPEEAAPAPPPPRAPHPAPRTLADRVSGLERAMSSLQHESSEFHQSMRREVSDLRREVRQEVSDLRRDVRQELSDLRRDLREDDRARHTEILTLLRSLGSGPPPSSSQ